MRYSRGEIQDTLIDMFVDEDPKILQKIKESINETICRQPFADFMTNFQNYQDKTRIS